MHEKAAFVFWTTLGLYLITLFTVSYVGVYLTYIAIPFITLSGLVMLISKPSKKTQEYIKDTKSLANEAMTSLNSGVDSLAEWADHQRKLAEEKALEVQKNHKEKMCRMVEDEIEKKRQKIANAEGDAKVNKIGYDEYLKVKRNLEAEILTLKGLLDKDTSEIVSFFTSQ